MKKLIDKVDDGFNYFHSGILQELTTDKKFYVQAFMDYIEHLESRTKELAEEVKKIDLSKYEIDYLTMVLEQKMEERDFEDPDDPFLIYQNIAIKNLYSKLIILTKTEKDEENICKQ